MTQLEQLQAAVADLTQAQADSTAKVDVLLLQNDALIGLTDSISAQLDRKASCRERVCT